MSNVKTYLLRSKVIDYLDQILGHAHSPFFN